MADAPQYLSEKEQALRAAWKETKNKPSLAPALSAQLFELFVHGLSCQDIVDLNRGVYKLEQVLEVRVRDGWDERRKQYVDQLFGSVIARVAQTQVESVGFITDMLAAAHKRHGDKLQKYLQTGDESDLPRDINIDSWTNYKSAVETLLKITGQEKSGRLPFQTGRDKPDGEQAGGEQKSEEKREMRLLPAGGVKVLTAAESAAILGVKK